MGWGGFSIRPSMLLIVLISRAGDHVPGFVHYLDGGGFSGTEL